ncbi:hypothetical protein EKD16_09360 [Streptomonospora litoralis]|uniref:DUF5753 domain-containing protein n=1 Tax=Streptomonospora litoralis TaxID=2498135 RepID=A0A4P6PZD0_9ACTN|nr:hypothetical protein EKD16_09360 [Streptomonospora litoralis]
MARPSARLRHSLDDAIGHGRLNRLWEDLTGDGQEAWRYEVAELVLAATVIYDYEVLVFPAHMQTEAYSRALIRYGAPWMSTQEVEEEVQARKTRGEHVANGSGPKIWLVIDETIMARRYGGAATMREQLSYVVDLAEGERVTLQMVRASEPCHPGNSGPFNIITSPKAPDALFAENAREGQLSTNPEHLRRYRMLFAALQGVAAGPAETLTAMRNEIKRLDDE